MTSKRFGFLVIVLLLTAALVVSACGGGGDKTSGGKDKGGGKEKVVICHKTDDASKPYVELSIPENAAKGHAKHEGDIIPAPDGGCPK